MEPIVAGARDPPGQPADLDSAARARLRVDRASKGREHLQDIEGPVIFAANHQSHMDTPVIMAALPARWRYRVAPAMAKEFFKAHFFPAEHGRRGVVHQLA